MAPHARDRASYIPELLELLEASGRLELLDDGATVPFIARYRKEVTGGLDDTQLRNLEERLGYLRELEDRRAAVIESIRTHQGFVRLQRWAL